MITALTSTRAQGPRRRFRGKKRYFRRVHQNAESFRIATGPGEWWDLWHYHADRFGWGNLKWRYRREHIRALAKVFLGIARVAEEFTTPFQLWILLSGRDAGEDATYLHTPNGNKTPFPVPFGEIAWDHRPLLQLFADLLPGLDLRVGEARSFDEYAEPPRVVSSFFIYSPGIGVPLEAGSPSTRSVGAG
jgi:hypothetical protein